MIKKALISTLIEKYIEEENLNGLLKIIKGTQPYISDNLRKKALEGIVKLCSKRNDYTPLLEIEKYRQLSSSLKAIVRKKMSELGKQRNKEVKKLEEIKRKFFIYYKEKYKTGDGGNLVPIFSLLPNKTFVLKEKFPLKILAFSDYRVQELQPLTEYLKTRKEKPDIIVYAGDDIERFVPPPLDYLADIEKVHIFKAIDDHHPPMIAGICTKTFYILKAEIFKNALLFFILRFPKNFERKKIKEKLNAFFSTFRDMEKASHRIKLDNTKTDEYGQKFYLAIDYETQLELCRFLINNRSLHSNSNYEEMWLTYKCFYETYSNTNDKLLSLIYLGSDDNYDYYSLPYFNQPNENYFEKLAHYTRYGLFAVVGNDDEKEARLSIRGKKVYEIFSSIVKVGPINIIGLEGSTCGMGPNGTYQECDIRLRLEYIRDKIKNKEMIVIISHTPPRGILDRAFRFGERSIGSIALREFIEEEPRVKLVICGHVHNCDGKVENLNNASIINVSSHDGPFDKANIAWITIDRKRQKGRYTWQIDVKIEHLPSLLESLITKGENVEEIGKEIPNELKEKYKLNKENLQLFVEYSKKYGSVFFEDLSKLVEMKFKTGLPWKVVLLLYDKGIKEVAQVRKDSLRNVLSQLSGIYYTHAWRTYLNLFKRSRTNKVYLASSLPIKTKKIIILDTEYYSQDNTVKGVLYGFLDTVTNEVRQFWFDEREKIVEFVTSKINESYIFVYWGGADKKLLYEEIGTKPEVFNLLYFCQTSLIAPITSTTLKEVHDLLCEHKNDEWWKINFYDKDGIIKNGLCASILLNPKNSIARKQLEEANRADLLALKNIYDALMKLPVKEDKKLIDYL